MRGCNYPPSRTLGSGPDFQVYKYLLSLLNLWPPSLIFCINELWQYYEKVRNVMAWAGLSLRFWSKCYLWWSCPWKSLWNYYCFFFSFLFLPKLMFWECYSNYPKVPKFPQSFANSNRIPWTLFCVTWWKWNVIRWAASLYFLFHFLFYMAVRSQIS